MLYNEKFTDSAVASYLYQDCIRQVSEGEHYLLIQDTTQINFESNRSNISDKTGLGVIGDNKSLGFFLHPSLLVSASDKRSLGFIDIQYWSREVSKPLGTSGKRMKNAEKAIEEKESYRWLSSIESAKSRLGNCQITAIADREGDISELFARIPDERTNLLIRSRDDRRLEGGQKLYAYLEAQAVAGSYEIELKGDKRNKSKRVGRKALIEVKYGSVVLSPTSLKDEKIPVFVVEARETASTVPQGQKPIHWRLLTTHPINTLERAIEIIEYYKERWLIEQIFRLLKNKGLQVEDLQIESGKALICLTLIGLQVVNRVMLLHEASKQDKPVAIKETFQQEELECLRACNQKYEGKTLRQKNPYPPNSLQWVYWVIARMGGWKPQEKQAGVIVIFRGLQYFQQVFEGWKLAKLVS